MGTRSSAPWHSVITCRCCRADYLLAADHGACERHVLARPIATGRHVAPPSLLNRPASETKFDHREKIASLAYFGTLLSQRPGGQETEWQDGPLALQHELFPAKRLRALSGPACGSITACRCASRTYSTRRSPPARTSCERKDPLLPDDEAAGGAGSRSRRRTLLLVQPAFLGLRPEDSTMPAACNYLPLNLGECRTTTAASSIRWTSSFSRPVRWTRTATSTSAPPISGTARSSNAPRW